MIFPGSAATLTVCGAAVNFSDSLATLLGPSSAPFPGSALTFDRSVRLFPAWREFTTTLLELFLVQWLVFVLAPRRLLPARWRHFLTQHRTFLAVPSSARLFLAHRLLLLVPPQLFLAQ